MNILIYFPYNSRTVEQQSVMEILLNKGHRVFLLTLTQEGELHTIVRKLGVEAFASGYEASLRPGSIFANARVLAKFCREHAVDLVLAHQQSAVLPLLLAKPLIRAGYYYIRHNSDEDYLNSPLKAGLLNRFINRLAKKIIAPSDIVYRYMVHKEQVPASKMLRVNYGYNFEQYEKPDTENAKKIRGEHPCTFLILSIARLVPAKRHSIMFEVVKQMLKEGFDVKMICLGVGSSDAELQQWVKENSLEERIFFKGRKKEIFDYLVASDVLFHLSATEASNSVVKETGWAGRTAVVCERVGDFSDYVVNGENGFLVNKENPFSESLQAMKKLYQDPELRETAGRRLKEKVVERFDIKNLTEVYDRLINNQQ